MPQVLIYYYLCAKFMQLGAIYIEQKLNWMIFSLLCWPPFLTSLSLSNGIYSYKVLLDMAFKEQIEMSNAFFFMIADIINKIQPEPSPRLARLCWKT